MIGEGIRVRVGGKSITVPLYGDRRATLRLVKRVNERLEEIEKKHPRIDTQAFALEAAVAFAAELAEAEALHEEETTEVFNDLDSLSKSVDALIREYGLQDG